jgi:hypothetical protein
VLVKELLPLKNLTLEKIEELIEQAQAVRMSMEPLKNYKQYVPNKEVQQNQVQ